MNVDRIEAILRLLQRHPNAGELIVEGEGWRLSARKGRGIPPSYPPTEAEPASAELEPERLYVRAGRVGIFRAGKPALQKGDAISRGRAVGQIDSMRILNPVVSEEDGYVTELLVEDGDAVEYGQALFVLAAEPALPE